MWWSPLVPGRRVVLPEPREELDTLLRRQGLSLGDGLWRDAAHTVGVARSPGGLFVGWLDVGWSAPDVPFSEMRDIAHLVEGSCRELLARDLCFALKEARCLRAERLRTCAVCEERFVPGQMLGVSRCRACAGHGAPA